MMTFFHSQYQFHFFRPNQLVFLDAKSPAEQLQAYQTEWSAKNPKTATAEKHELSFSLQDLQDLQNRFDAQYDAQDVSEDSKTRSKNKIKELLRPLEAYLFDLQKSQEPILKESQNAILSSLSFDDPEKNDRAQKHDAARADVVAWVDKNITEYSNGIAEPDTFTKELRFTLDQRQELIGFLMAAKLTLPDSEYQKHLTNIQHTYEEHWYNSWTVDDFRDLQLSSGNTNNVRTATQNWLYSALKSHGIPNLAGYEAETYLTGLLMRAETFLGTKNYDAKFRDQFYDAYKNYVISILVQHKSEIQEWSSVSTDDARSAASGVLDVFSSAPDYEKYEAGYNSLMNFIHTEIPTPDEWFENLKGVAMGSEKVAPVEEKVAEAGGEKIENAELMKDPDYKNYYEKVLMFYKNFTDLEPSTPLLSPFAELGISYPAFVKTKVLFDKVKSFGDIKDPNFLTKFKDPSTGTTAREVDDAAYKIRSQAEKFLNAYKAAMAQRCQIVKSQLTNNEDLKNKYTTELGRIDTLLTADFAATNFLDASNSEDLKNISAAFFDLLTLEKELGITPPGTPVGAPAAAGTPTDAPASAAGDVPSAAPAASSDSAGSGGAAGGTTTPDAQPDAAAAGTGTGSSGSERTNAGAAGGTTTDGEKPADAAAAEPAGESATKTPSEDPEKLTDEQKNTIREKASDYFDIAENGILTFKGAGDVTKEQAEKALRMQDIFDPKYNPFVFMVSPGKKVFTVAHFDAEAGKYMRRFSEESGDMIPAYIHEGYRFLKSAAMVPLYSIEIFADMPSEKDAAAEYVKDKYTKLVGADGKIADEISRAVFAAMLNYFSANVLKKEDPVVLHYPLVLSDTVTINYVQDGFSQSDIEKVWNGESLAGDAAEAGQETAYTKSFDEVFAKLPNGVMDRDARNQLEFILRWDFLQIFSYFRKTLATHADTPYVGDAAKTFYDALISKTQAFQKNVSKYLDAPDTRGNRLNSFAPIPHEGMEKVIQFTRSQTLIDHWAVMADATKDSNDARNYVQLLESLEAAKDAPELAEESAEE